jgi:DNA-binding transcriptional LysR family regulator
MGKSERIERRLKLHDMRVLMSVVEAGSMAKAAERLGTSQPAVSRSVADLEHTLGVRLLERSPQGVEPTPYAHAIIRRGVAVFDELRQGVEDIAFLADPTAGELRIGCPEAIAAGPVLLVINRLTRRHPRMTFHVATGVAPRIYRGLIERTIEVGISRVTASFDAASLHAETLFDDMLVIAAGANNPLMRRRRIELGELLAERWVLAPTGSLSVELMIEAFRAAGLEPPRPTVVTESLSMRNRLLTTAGFLTIIHGFALAVLGRHPTIKPLPVALPTSRRPIALMTLKKRTPSPLAEYFMENMRAIARPLAAGGATNG